MKFLRRLVRYLLLEQIAEERYILERKIFPKIKNKKILWVGCAHYTVPYLKKLKGNDVWTIDIDPKMAKFGGEKHIIDTIVNADKYFKKNFLDIIFMTGVFGYGLNTKKEADSAMKTCYDILNKKGILVIWWKDVEGHNQINPKKLSNFKLFKLLKIAKYPSGYKTKKEVILEFLRKS